MMTNYAYASYGHTEDNEDYQYDLAVDYTNEYIFIDQYDPRDKWGNIRIEKLGMPVAVFKAMIQFIKEQGVKLD